MLTFFSSKFKHPDHKESGQSMVPPQESMFDLSELHIGPWFASGANSKIFHGTYGEIDVAIKILKPPEIVTDNSYEDSPKRPGASLSEKLYNQESLLLSRLNHPNVIKLVAAYREPGTIHYLVTEYMSKGSLRKFLNQQHYGGTRLSMQQVIKISLDIARGMEYVHSQGVIHRDLKPENILIDRDFHMKVADFGVSCLEREALCSGEQPGSYRWMAPEMIKRKTCNRKVDVYSFGLMLSEMVAGEIPFKSLEPVQAACAVVHKNARPILHAGCPPLMRTLIEQCWSLEPKKRPEFQQIVKVLEQFESSLATHGSLNLVQNFPCQNQKKTFLSCFHCHHSVSRATLQVSPVVS